ncbi:hypothetical protein [Pseudomonas sp. Irchel s3h17]|uniref:hypothetical protein n=1 Tax=Pseudomonas sp. Irchel s3h17 TaxID=2009182 RepID=UPI00155DE6D4|nr:hypothetical protein [Pseudomonas sp. Irchel s3h17]
MPSIKSTLVAGAKPAKPKAGTLLQVQEIGMRPGQSPEFMVFQVEYACLKPGGRET